MANLSMDYVEFLYELRGAPLRQVLYQHQLFWLEKASNFKREFGQSCLVLMHTILV